MRVKSNEAVESIDSHLTHTAWPTFFSSHPFSSFAAGLSPLQHTPLTAHPTTKLPVAPRSQSIKFTLLALVLRHRKGVSKYAHNFRTYAA